MTSRVIEDERMPPALGPYSQAVAAGGELIFVSGQPGMDVSTGEIPTSFDRQARHAFENLAQVLDAAGLTMSDVVKTTVYLTDANQFQALNALFAEYFPSSPPTRAAPIVELPKGLSISIEAIAVRR